METYRNQFNLLLLACALATGLSLQKANAQDLNLSFESWEEVDGILQPTGWTVVGKKQWVQRDSFSSKGLYGVKISSELDILETLTGITLRLAVTEPIDRIEYDYRCVRYGSSGICLKSVFYHTPEDGWLPNRLFEVDPQTHFAGYASGQIDLEKHAGVDSIQIGFFAYAATEPYYTLGGRVEYLVDNIRFRYQDERLNLELEEDAQGRAFPNPTAGYVYIFEQAAIQTVKIINQMGALVRQQPVRDVQFGDILRMDLSPLPSGVYYLIGTTDSGEVAFRTPVIKR
jgi:hypothetical protein